jgi:hypothetical protein
METRRPTLVVYVLSLLAAILMTTRADLPAETLASSVTVPIAGTVDGLPESVSLSGSLQIVSTLVTDALLEDGPKVRLAIKAVDVSGVGLTSGATYAATGENMLIRRLAISDQFEVMVPFFRATADGPLSARSAMATLALKFDLTTGALTGATATLSAPKLAG